MTAPNGAAPAEPGPVDPAVHLRAAVLARETYTESLAAVRADTVISELERAERIDRAHSDYEHQLDYLAANLTAARRARLAHVEAQLPAGPGIDPGTSEADATVLRLAFQNALETARTATDMEALAARLDDAVRFGDRQTERGIVTALLDQPGKPGTQQLVTRWAERVAARGGGDHRPLLAERHQLRTRLGGAELSLEAEAESRAFSQRTRPKPPPELADLPQLRYEAEQRQRAARQGVTVPRPTPGTAHLPSRVRHLPGGPYSRPVRALGD